MSNRITSTYVEDLAEAALELLTQNGQRAMSMHEVASQAYSPGKSLPEFMTTPALDANLRVRKALEERGAVIVPIALPYWRKIKGRVFTESEVMGCLPRRGSAQYGLLFIDGESPEHDVLVWHAWVRRVMSSATKTAENVRVGVLNAERKSLITSLESQQMLAIEAGSLTEPAPV